MYWRHNEVAAFYFLFLEFSILVCHYVSESFVTYIALFCDAKFRVIYIIQICNSCCNSSSMKCEVGDHLSDVYF